MIVATVLTACGIETYCHYSIYIKFTMLQQYLPLAVLKPEGPYKRGVKTQVGGLQQYLPLAVLKHGMLRGAVYS